MGAESFFITFSGGSDKMEAPTEAPKKSRFTRGCIRRAGDGMTSIEEDAKMLVSLIMELAAYEKLEHEAIPTVPLIEHVLLGDAEAPIYVYFAYDPETQEPIGFVLCYLVFSTFKSYFQVKIEDLYVRESCRGQGVGRLLTEEVAGLAQMKSAERIDLDVLKWNEGAIGMYKKMGGKEREEWTSFRFEGEALTKLTETFERSCALQKAPVEKTREEEVQ